MVTSNSAAICQVSPSHVRSAMANSDGLISIKAVSRRALRSHFTPNRVPQAEITVLRVHKLVA